MTSLFPLHAQAQARLPLPPAAAFALLDDHRQLTAHMQSRSMMMMGSSMHVLVDEEQFQAVGSRIRMAGRVLGIPLTLDEEVVLREPPWRKAWQTLGEPRLLVIGSYRMGFVVMPAAGGGANVSVTIDYALPRRGIGRWLGRWFGPAYARWCTQRMLRDAAAANRGTPAPQHALEASSREAASR